MAIDVEIKSAWPVAGIRSPGFATTLTEGEDGMLVHWEKADGSLEKDFVLYYRLKDDPPARIEVVPFKTGTEDPGTFMMVVTPGIGLQPLVQGSDYVFVLDISGSMSGKLGTRVTGVKKTIQSFRPEDRFRIVLFNNNSEELTRGWVSATAEQVDHALGVLDRVRSGGGTNVYSGLERGLRMLDNDRVTSFILVTDGVTNTGIVEPEKFAGLMSRADIRFFGFLLGNQSNWPLMETVCRSTGGYYQQVSNSDDIIGRILLAKSKVLHESIHDFDLKIKGGGVFDVSPTRIKKVFRGQQLVFFGRYADAGPADLEIRARISGKDEVYRTRFHFPERDTRNPEIERLWALNRIHQLEMEKTLGQASPEESESAIEDLVVQYQLVTDYTSMLVLSGQQFQQYGIDRRNLDRTQTERQAFEERRHQPVVNYRVDQNQPAFGNDSRAASMSGGKGGAGSVSPWVTLIPGVAAIFSHLLPEHLRAGFQFDREAIFDGEIWRILTATWFIGITPTWFGIS